MALRLQHKRMYRIWAGMKHRAKNKIENKPCYDSVTLDEKSWEKFENFLKDMIDGYSDNLSLDRIDTNKGYSKENCRWVSSSAQNYNKNISVKNKSGKTGVFFDTKRNQWRVRFRLNGKTLKNSWFEYLIDAIFYRMQLEQEYFGCVKL